MKGESTSLTMVGERTNVTGSPRFRKLIESEDYEAALKLPNNRLKMGQI